jgi:hypothetical protein
MPYQLLKPVDRELLPPLRWQRGLIVDADPEHVPALLALGATEVTRDDAAEVIVDKPHRGAKAVKDEKPEDAPVG